MALKQFKAESKRLLDLMINSIYTNKEIFLREIISNASDAIDKLHFISLTDSAAARDFEIRIDADKNARTLTVTDNGIGMTAAELEQKCTDYLHLRPSQPEMAAALLERELHLKRWEMRPEGEIRIYEAADTRAVGQVLAQAGIAVEEMGLHRQDLESYFLERMGGADHV